MRVDTNTPRALCIKPLASYIHKKGGIKAINKIIRQYFPKGTDFNQVKHQNIINVQHRINARPREKLNFLSPVEVFFKFCR